MGGPYKGSILQDDGFHKIILINRAGMNLTQPGQNPLNIQKPVIPLCVQAGPLKIFLRHLVKFQEVLCIFSKNGTHARKKIHIFLSSKRGKKAFVRISADDKRYLADTPCGDGLIRILPKHVTVHKGLVLKRAARLGTGNLKHLLHRQGTQLP